MLDLTQFDLKKLLEGIALDRDLVFTSLSSVDQDTAMKLIKRLTRMSFRQWCMYREDGSERNISGDDYTQPISWAISRCCIFVFLVSENSLGSPKVKDELTQISQAVKDGCAKVVPVLIEDTSYNAIPEDIAELAGFVPTSIMRHLHKNGTDEELNGILKEIEENYFNIIFENIKRKFEFQKKSQILNELMNACVRNKCNACSISDDIKESTEISADSLHEMHVLSNEVLEYDCNTYSCMVIASNLLGAEETVNGTKTFNPERNGVKYFYYTPPRGEMECYTAFAKIEDFIRKTKDSRREVTSLIRREFSHRNKVATFFREFNGMTISDFKEQYHIEVPDDVSRFNKLFYGEHAQGYFDYSDEEDVFTVPEEFFAWICGDNEKYSYNTMIEISYKFIEFIHSFVSFLRTAKDINSVSYDLLRRRHIYLERFKKLEEWQMGNYLDISDSESKRLVNYLLDYTADVSTKRVKKFPRLASWMQFNRNAQGQICDIDESVVKKALNNLICVPINEDDRLQLSYSFALFIGRSDHSGAWYTTGSGVTNERTESTVTTYSFERQSPEFNGLLNAFSYLLSINPQGKDLLKKHNSELLRILKESKKRGTQN